MHDEKVFVASVKCGRVYVMAGSEAVGVRGGERKGWMYVAVVGYC